MRDEYKGNWNYPTQMIFGAGSILQLADQCKILGITKPLFITDQGLKDHEIVKSALRCLKSDSLLVSVFSDIKANPVGRNVVEGVSSYHRGGHDGVIAFGGGSAIDAAKAIALMVGQTRPLWDFVDEGNNWQRVDTTGMAPVIAVPTTAGTGSEVGRASVITNEDTYEKKIIFHPHMMPLVVIADPELTFDLPAHITAATGIDAFVHCFEAFCAPSFHPMADGVALEGMRLIKEYLPAAVKNGHDLKARSHMLAAASMGATAFQKGLGGVHALAHPLGALFDKHHGLLNAILLPYVVERNRSVIEEDMIRIARYLDLNGSGVEAVMSFIINLRQSLNIPHSLSEIGIGAERAQEIGVMALADPSASGNPASLSAKDYENIFLAAVSGSLPQLQQVA